MGYSGEVPTESELLRAIACCGGKLDVNMTCRLALALTKPKSEWFGGYITGISAYATSVGGQWCVGPNNVLLSGVIAEICERLEQITKV